MNEYNLQNQFTFSFADEYNPTVGGVEESSSDLSQQLAITQESGKASSDLGAQTAAAMSITGLTAMCAIIKGKRKEEV